MSDVQTDQTTDQTDDTGPSVDDKTTEWTPPTKDEWEKTQRALNKANAEAKDRREKLRELQAKSEDADSKAAREQAEAAEKRYKPIAVRAAAKAAFLEAGLQGGSPERVAKLVRMLDLDAIVVDEDGDVAGLDDQVSAIKNDYPELFASTEKRPPRITTGDKPGTNGRTMSVSERQAAQVLGR